jgi:DNA polymerase
MDRVHFEMRSVVLDAVDFVRVGESAGGPVAEDGAVSYMGIDQYTRKWTRIGTHGGKLCENIVQAIARDVMAANMPLIEAAGYQIILTVHDEIIAETPDEPGYHVEQMADLLAEPPAWALDMPLAAAGFETHRYRKG